MPVSKPSRAQGPVATPQSTPRTANARQIGIGIAVSVLAAAVYANALGNQLVWDDPIVLTRQLQAFRSLGDLLFPPRDIPQFSPDYYRPLTTLSYLLDRAIGGSGPFMFHFSVVLYHAVATFLVFRLGLVLVRGDAWALSVGGLGAALFAVHPIHTESVAWGAGRSDVLACVFGLAGTLIYLQARWSPLWRAALAALLLSAAALAKETAVPLLVLVPLSPLVLGIPAAAAPATRATRRRKATPTPDTSPYLQCVPFAAALLVYLVLRNAALQIVVGTRQPLDASAVATLFGALGLYAGKMLLPLRQCAYISNVPGHAALLALAGIGMTAVSAGAIIAWRAGQRVVVWLLLWTALTLAPSLVIPFKLPAVPVAERYLYLPSVGCCLLAAYGVVRGLRAIASMPLRAALAAVVAAILVVAIVATVQRNAVWRDNLSLWTDTAAQNKTDGLPIRSLGTAYLNAGQRGPAAEAFRVALTRRNDARGLLVIHNNLGSLAMQEQRFDDAAQHYGNALHVDPHSPDAIFNLALIDLTRAAQAQKSGDHAAAVRQASAARGRFEQSLQLNPHDPDTHIALGQTFVLLDDPKAARQQYERALSLGVGADREQVVRRLLADLAGNEVDSR